MRNTLNERTLFLSQKLRYQLQNYRATGSQQDLNKTVNLRWIIQQMFEKSITTGGGVSFLEGFIKAGCGAVLICLLHYLYVSLDFFLYGTLCVDVVPQLYFYFKL
jgi:hypothetical protein